MAKAVFTNQITDYIIENVQAAEFMWNHASPLYKLKSMKSDFWMKLTKEINAKFHPTVQLSQGDISRKWNNLKSYYTFESQKVMKAKQCEFAPETFEVDWKNKSKMDFLAKTLSPQIAPSKRIRSESATKPDVADDEYFNNSNFESQDESWSGDTGTQSSFQVPELAIDVEEEKYSETLKRTESTQKMEDRHTASLDNAHSSSHLPVLTSDEEEQKSHINTYKRHRETTDRLATMVANLIEHQNTLFTQRPNQQSSLQHPEMYAFWDSIIKDIPPEALPEIKFEVTAVLHSIYKKYKN
ncbi:uncharacterized protein LOC133846443 isoform X3 [Drosophila sulfurigaster albostrigata]|uniref:uncharacterized protein LOC133846443 isoform X3 n=1 Tax=Drosophila sulfurigaster albostrigata TaxID=89887 RepID=UPI002D21B541|nr:uncharacterized protein LOC133846443 isoform X3 [Drosophila sulfurigaster albostrigata]